MQHPDFMAKVDPDKAYRLLGIGATTLVSASDGKTSDVMAAAWACALDLTPMKATVVLDKSHYTRGLIERSNRFAIQLPLASIAKETITLGSVSMHDDSEKLMHSGARFFHMDGYAMPLVHGCAAWMVFDRISEPSTESKYDLFIGQCVAAWADTRIYRDGHFHFEDLSEDLRLLHYVAGGHFYRTGTPLDVEG